MYWKGGALINVDVRRWSSLNHNMSIIECKLKSFMTKDEFIDQIPNLNYSLSFTYLFDNSNWQTNYVNMHCWRCKCAKVTLLCNKLLVTLVSHDEDHLGNHQHHRHDLAQIWFSFEQTIILWLMLNIQSPWIFIALINMLHWEFKKLFELDSFDVI